MVEAGTALAVMGNHELNALAWATTGHDGAHLRPHTAKNRAQHQAFLEQLSEGSKAHADALGWFGTLPLWLDLGGLRVIHACWHPTSQAALSGFLDAENRLTDEGLVAIHDRRHAAYEAASVLLKGPEARLPHGRSFLDKDRHRRCKARLRWWDPTATTFRTSAIAAEDAHELPDYPVPDYHYDDTVPLLFGHYWMVGEPRIVRPEASCLDFSVARSGYLTAYRWSGEKRLETSALVWVAA